MKSLKYLLAALTILGLVNFFRPWPQPKLIYDLSAPPITPAQKIDWPVAKQVAVGAVGFGVLDAKTADKAVPTASVAKIMTALAVLKQKPLSVTKAGPDIKFTAGDVELYRRYLAKNGSVIPVAAGQKVSERQALEAMLVPSANNFADSLAIWTFGSLKAYRVYANQLAVELGLSDTKISDASGFSPKTVSTASDLVILGEAAMRQPVIADIVKRKAVKLPLIGRVNNTNGLLGIDGINGIKTGHTDQAGTNFLFSSRQKIGNQNIAIIGALTGAESSFAAQQASRQLIKTTLGGFEAVNVSRQDQVVAHYQTAWGQTVPLVAAQDLTVAGWRGKAIQITIQAPQPKIPTNGGSVVGNLEAISGELKPSVNLVLNKNLPAPSYWWRLTRL